MIIYSSNYTDKLYNGAYVALGSFDGLHKGHMTLINKAIELGKAKNAVSMVYTFENHPLTIINKSIAPKLIIDNETKAEILDKLNVDAACFVKFDESFMKLSPEEFIVRIKDSFNMKGVIAGFNFKFGHKNSGNIDTLRALGEKYGFEVYIMEALTYEDEVISSSKIRVLLQEGNIREANKLLMIPFMIKGAVVSGKRLGRTIGFPTANIKLNDELLHPKVGVYYTNVIVGNQCYRGITNIGYNPTVQGKDLTCETYILDFDYNIYDETIKVYFIDRIRDEIRFDSINELVVQMNLDKTYAETKKIELIL
jgi:riboflavin kinase / FMN adenylyltransferase